MALAPSTAEAAPLATSSEEVQLSSKEDYIAYIDKEAPQYGVSPAKVEAIVNCETANTWNPTIQSEYVRNDKRELSFGLAQLNLPSHPNISYKEAINPKFSLDYLMKHLADHSDHWSCERLV